jgi:2,3-bisphosphoglycerate-dependent phosphoglycerate mutase
VRVKEAFEALAREHGGSRLAVVAHGGVLASLYRVIHGLPIASPHPIPIANASFNALAFDGSRWTVEAWGDTSHLDAGALFETL